MYIRKCENCGKMHDTVHGDRIRDEEDYNNCMECIKKKYLKSRLSKKEMKEKIIKVENNSQVK